MGPSACRRRDVVASRHSLRCIPWLRVRAPRHAAPSRLTPHRTPQLDKVLVSEGFKGFLQLLGAALPSSSNFFLSERRRRARGAGGGCRAGAGPTPPARRFQQQGTGLGHAGRRADHVTCPCPSCARADFLSYKALAGNCLSMIMPNDGVFLYPLKRYLRGNWTYSVRCAASAFCC